jgi:hypothetical protein
MDARDVVVSALRGEAVTGQRNTLEFHELTDAGKLRRRNERCRAAIGISFTALATLTATVTRWCCRGNLLSTRAEIRDAIAEEASVLTPDFDALRRLGLVEVARTEATRQYYRPTRRGVLKIIELGGIRERVREIGRSAAE